MSEIKATLQADMKTAMKQQDKQQLSTIRLIINDIKKKEIDERIELNDEQVLAILDKMAKQRRESIEQYQAGGRDDLVAQEQFELSVIQSYLPSQLSSEEINQLIEQCIAEAGAESMRDMGKVMALLKPQIQGRADTGAVSKQVKERLA